jgi:hypothetical protein
MKRQNPPENPMDSMCGAKTRAGNPCKRRPMPNGRCKMHGGPSTGPRTPEGLERLRKARTKHGGYSSEAKALRACIQRLRKESKRLVEIKQ